MNAMYEQFRETLEWKPQQGEAEIPGLTAHGAPTDILARSEQRIVMLGGDRVANIAIAVMPQHDVKGGDLLGGAEVLEVEEVKDREDNVLWRVCYATV